VADFSLNPFKWFKSGPKTAKFSALASGNVLKPRATPRKSGNVFMHLITIQKSLQSLELALRQEIDSTWLIQKIAGQISVLKLEAETVDEDELSAAAGQVLAYFETISEGRLYLNADGVTMVREFVHIFKDAIGDAAPGVNVLNENQLRSWNSRYQTIMSRMRPIFEDGIKYEAEVTEAAESTDVDHVASAEDDVIERAEEVDRKEILSSQKPIEGIRNPVLDALLREKASADHISPREDDIASLDDADRHEVAERKERAEETAKAPVIESLSPYDRGKDKDERDVVIPDEEFPRARESGELEETKVSEKDSFHQQVVPVRPMNDRETGTSEESPVELEEVERLKSKLFELHERQEVLSSKMSGILGGLEKAVKGEEPSEEPVSIEKLGIEELEDIIFIGRKKG